MKSDPEHPLDGISLAVHLKDPSRPLISRQLFSQWSGRIAMRQDQYLLDNDGAIFNLVNDPTQQQDLIAEESERASSMTSDVKKWREEVLRSAQTNRPFLVGHTHRPTTLLPAQDGKCQGLSVKRSDTAPNCSFFTNIRSQDDQVVWDIQPLQSTTYSVWIHYTATTSALGKRLKLQVGDRQIEGTIDEAFESTLRGQSSDRVPRKSESLMKDFGSFELGSMLLGTDRVDCRLQLIDPILEPGMIEIQAIEFRK
jgi:hypothetical protein